MKIIILNNQIQNVSAMQQGLEKARQLCSSIGLTLEITYQIIDETFDSQPLSSDVVLQGFGINPQQILTSAIGTADVVCLISPWSKVRPNNFSVSNPINPCTYDLDKSTLNNTLAMEICEEWYGSPIAYPDVLTQFFLHELCHALYDRQNTLLDITHSQYASSYSQKPPVDYYLYLLSSLVPQPTNPVPTYQYFKPSEIVNLKPELVTLLDRARGIAGIPFKITSGYRTVAQNQAVGGKVNSAHLFGEAVDLACSMPLQRWLIVNALLRVGFVRLEIATQHIHADISKTLTQNIIDFSNDA